MPRPNIFPCDTVLYHPAEGARTFPQGEQDPGNAWSEKPGGHELGGATIAQATRELIEANDRIDALGQTLAHKDHDLAVIAAERDSAVNATADLEQRAIAAEKTQAEAEEQAAAYMRERDTARAQLEQSTAAVTAAEERADATEAKVQGLVDQLGVANQQIADLTAPPAKPAK